MIIDKNYLFGDPSLFAVESKAYHCDPHRGNIFGQMRIICGEQSMGEFETNLLMGTVKRNLDEILDDARPRYHPSLDGLPFEEALDAFMWALYEPDDNPEHRRRYGHYEQFRNDYPPMEICSRLAAAFDGDDAILLQKPDSDKELFIFRPFKDQAYCRELERGCVFSALSSFRTWLLSAPVPMEPWFKKT